MPRANGNESRNPRRAIAFATAIVVAAASLGAGAAFARTTGQRFTDPLRDANGGPDITRVAVSDAGGIVTFRFTVTGMKIVEGGPSRAATFYAGLDTDKNGKSNYFLDVYTASDGVSWDIQGPSEKPVKQ